MSLYSVSQFCLIKDIHYFIVSLYFNPTERDLIELLFFTLSSHVVELDTKLLPVNFQVLY